MDLILLVWVCIKEGSFLSNDSNCSCQASSNDWLLNNDLSIVFKSGQQGSHGLPSNTIAKIMIHYNEKGQSATQLLTIKTRLSLVHYWHSTQRCRDRFFSRDSLNLPTGRKKRKMPTFQQKVRWSISQSFLASLLWSLCSLKDLKIAR